MTERCHLFVPSGCGTPLGVELQTLLMLELVGLCSVHLRTCLCYLSCPPVWSGWWDTVSCSVTPVSNSIFRVETTAGQLIYCTAPAAGVTHRLSVVVCRVQVINQDNISEDISKHCKGSRIQTVVINLKELV